MVARKTVLFEKEYNTSISDFSTTEEIDSFIEKKLGRKLEIKQIESSVVTNRGSIFPSKEYDIDKMLDSSLGR